MAVPGELGGDGGGVNRSSIAAVVDLAGTGAEVGVGTWVWAGAEMRRGVGGVVAALSSEQTEALIGQLCGL